MKVIMSCKKSSKTAWYCVIERHQIAVRLDSDHKVHATFQEGKRKIAAHLEHMLDSSVHPFVLQRDIQNGNSFFGSWDRPFILQPAFRGSLGQTAPQARYGGSGLHRRLLRMRRER